VIAALDLYNVLSSGAIERTPPTLADSTSFNQRQQGLERVVVEGSLSLEKTFLAVCHEGAGGNVKERTKRMGKKRA